MISKTMKVDADTALEEMRISDFLPGLISESDYADLPPGACSNVLNWYFRPGRMVKRRGSQTQIPAMARNADGIASFVDDNLTRHNVFWRSGNLYSWDASFVVTLVQASCYTQGNRVCSAELNRKLYFSDGETIFTSGGDHSGIWEYDPVGAGASLVISSAAVGAIETPACKVMCARLGSLLLGRIKYVGGTYSKDSVMWTAVFDPTTIIGTNIFRIGDGQGGDVNCLVPFSVNGPTVSGGAITPYDAVFCGLSQFGVYQLKGALAPSTLTAIQITAATGVEDGASAQFIPAEAPVVVFLGNDRKIYATNGVSCPPISNNMTTELRDYINTRKSNVVGPIFTSGRNLENHQYILDLGGGRQYIYDWDYKYWTRYNWQSGYWLETFDSNGNPTIFTATVDQKTIVQQNTGTSDDGVPIAPYWESGWVGDQDINKIFKWAYLSYKTDTAHVTLTATVKQGRGSSASAEFIPDTVTLPQGVWDQSQWDGCVWSAGDVNPNSNPFKQKKRLFVANADNTQRSRLQGFDLKLNLSQNVDGYLEILDVNILYLPGGRKHVA